MNTPKSQNPEGKVAAWMISRDTEDGRVCCVILDEPSAEFFPGSTITPLIPATTHADMQRRLEEVKKLAAVLLNDYIAHATGDQIKAHSKTVKELRTPLLRDGKGDGVSTTEGGGVLSGYFWHADSTEEGCDSGVADMTVCGKTYSIRFEKFRDMLSVQAMIDDATAAGRLGAARALERNVRDFMGDMKNYDYLERNR